MNEAYLTKQQSQGGRYTGLNQPHVPSKSLLLVPFTQNSPCQQAAGKWELLFDTIPSYTKTGLTNNIYECPY